MSRNNFYFTEALVIEVRDIDLAACGVDLDAIAEEERRKARRNRQRRALKKGGR